MCDLLDSSFQNLILQRDSINRVFDEKSGWYTSQVLNELRNLIRTKLLVNDGDYSEDDSDQNARSVLNDEDRRIYEQIQDEEAGNDDTGVNEATGTLNQMASMTTKPKLRKLNQSDRYALLYQGKMNEEIKSRVSMNVNSMMKSLNADRNIVETDEGEEDFFDVFGDESD